MNETSNPTMGFDADAETPCLERLQREAQKCLNGFPNKVEELNAVIESYAPPSLKTASVATNCSRRSARVSRSRSVSSTIRDYDWRTARDLDGDISLASYLSISTYDRGRTRHGVCKRRYHRLRGFHGPFLRRYPGPLSRILGLIASSLVLCTRSLLLGPSSYIIDSLLLQSRRLKNAQCGTTSERSDSPSSYATATFKEDRTIVGSFIDILRPAAVRLIADTTILKRWLQAVALVASPPSVELVDATRTTETIDCWAYELFFHLKYLQVDRVFGLEKATAAGLKTNDEMTQTNLWHRVVQLRDNYIILYETLQDDKKFREKSPAKEELQ